MMARQRGRKRRRRDLDEESASIYPSAKRHKRQGTTMACFDLYESSSPNASIITDDSDIEILGNQSSRDGDQANEDDCYLSDDDTKQADTEQNQECNQAGQQEEESVKTRQS